MPSACRQEDVARTRKPVMETWDHLCAGNHLLVRPCLLYHLRRLYEEVEDVEPSAVDLTNVRSDEWWPGGKARGSYAVLTLAFLMVIASIRTGEQEWLLNEELRSLLRSLQGCCYDYSASYAVYRESWARVACLLGEEIESARLKNVEFMRKPFHEGVCSVKADERRVRSVGELCGESGCEMLKSVYLVATGRSPAANCSGGCRCLECMSCMRSRQWARTRGQTDEYVHESGEEKE